MAEVRLKVGMLCKLKDIPGGYRGRIGAIGDGGSSLWFEEHPLVPYSASSYEPDLEDERTKALVELQ